MNDGGVVIDVQHVEVNPYYDPWTTDNDISVLILSSVLEFSESIQPIRLVSSDDKPDAGADASVTGWGSIREGGGVQTNLQSVNFNIISRDDCNNDYSPYEITPTMLCAGANLGNF